MDKPIAVPFTIVLFRIIVEFDLWNRDVINEPAWLVEAGVADVPEPEQDSLPGISAQVDRLFQPGPTLAGVSMPAVGLVGVLGGGVVSRQACPGFPIIGRDGDIAIIETLFNVEPAPKVERGCLDQAEIYRPGQAAAQHVASV